MSLRQFLPAAVCRPNLDEATITRHAEARGYIRKGARRYVITAKGRTALRVMGW